MGGELKSQLSFRWVQILLGLSLFGAVLMPPMLLVSAWPTFEVSDLTFPLLVVLVLLFHRQAFFSAISKHRKWILAFVIFVGFTIVSILVNKRWFQIRDWFEVLKYTKFILFLVFFYLFYNRKQIFWLLTPLILAVFVFNLLHYFDVFAFNTIIEPWYAAPHHLDFFGLNSLGEPATKRALGTLGNPNTNGLLFLLFVLIFLPRIHRASRKDLVVLAISILGIFMCQSRTGILAYVLVLVAFFILNKPNWRLIGGIVTYSIAIYFVLMLMGNLYLNSIGNLAVMKSAGVGRIEQWMRILDAMPGHWIFGHAPEKEYFETNGIYSESEYFLILFRYGIVGLLSFLMFWGIWLKETFNKMNRKLSLGLLLALVYLFAAITNNPLQAPKIALILGLVMALTLIELDERKEEI